MQALTPEQSTAVAHFLWEALDKVIWALIVWGGVRLHRSIKSIRPGIVADVIAHVEKTLDEHKADDKRQFDEVKKLIGEVDISAVMSRHVRDMHARAAGAD